MNERTDVVVMKAEGKTPRTELGVNLDGFLSVLESFGEGGQLHVGSSTVVEASGVGGIAFDALRVVLDSPSEVATLELDVALLPRGCAQLGVDVGLAIRLSLCLLDLLELVEDIGCPVLGQRFVEELDGVIIVALAGVGGPRAPQSLRHQLVICAKLRAKRH